MSNHAATNGVNAFDARKTRKARLQNSRIRSKQAQWRQRLNPTRLLWSSSSGSLSKVFPILLIGILSIWLCTSLFSVYQISQAPMAQPMVTDAKTFLSRLKNDALQKGLQVSERLLVPSSKFSKKQEGEMIDMRELDATLPFDNPDGGAWKQGWDVQPVKPTKENPVKIFVVPHSHCDPGWIKTFDDYFQSQTKQILTSVINALAKDPKRRFIWAEISYFEWWWKEQTPQVQQLTKALLANGQLEFVTGGWVMPDEANTQLYAMEIQLQEGHDWIKKTLGHQYIPKYGWSIDPFGYSPTMAYLLKNYGFKAMLIQRVHYAVKKELAKTKHLEFNWRQVWDDEGEYDIFCHVMPFFSYDVPHTCGPDPSVCCQFDFARMKRIGCPWRKNPKEITDSNLQERSMLLLDQYLKKASLYRSNVVIAPLGDDFRYQTAEEAELQFTNYQKIFDYINTHVEGVQIQFGTLSEYFEAAMGTFEPPLLKGSFFTYSDVNEDYWSGYYTSRVFDKSLDRLLEQSIFAATALGADKEDLQEPRRALSLFQHHDGVTGTARDHVVQDYAKRIHAAIAMTQEFIGPRIAELSNLDSNQKLLPCWRSAEPRGIRRNECNLKNPVYVFNPLKTSQTCGDVEVAPYQAAVAHLPCDVAGPLVDSTVNIQFDPVSGLMTHPIREEWMTWHDKGNGKAGAYLFAPDRLEPFLPKQQTIQIKKGGYSVVSNDERGKWKRRVVERRVPSDFGSTSTVIDFIFETDLKSDDREWFARFTGNVNNKGVFHTDLNGFNFDTHYFRKDLPLQSQVFPMPTLASIEDAKSRMTILSNHAQGTASFQDGSIDVWLDRRLSTDDSRGLGQGVRDNVATRTILRVVLEPQIFGSDTEFRVTPLCSRMWNELNHPLEIFGPPGDSVVTADNPGQQGQQAEVPAVNKPALDRMWDALHGFRTADKPNPVPQPEAQVAQNAGTTKQTVVPFVFMVYKRVDFFKKVVDSLRKSDFPRSVAPLIISHDGHFEDFVAYVQTLKGEGFKVIQLFHPFSCAEHPDTFPGPDPKLNEGYRGDSYGHPREAWVTCCKHHFTWLMKTVFALDLGPVRAESFLFMEEDYVVAPTIYSAIQSGLNLMETSSPKPVGGYFGLVLDTSDGFTKPYNPNSDQFWGARRFITGPMVLPRVMFERIRDNAREYCTFDDYNWDWSLVHMQGAGILPHTVLVPSRPQVLHIGFEGGMHEKDIKPAVRAAFKRSGGIAPPFKSEKVYGPVNVKTKVHKRGYGGWGHPADHQHCLDLIGR
ncbi:Alpha-mannosidase 2 [Seminavis robusta]|uniref:Alpha-mannosidase 2 n=1 Tax=Seminavis robusta TaxID=568900 RepID=A0A9N8DHS7_9STRA|nr:Alpha-mannosidase 2 [Seminavis robusta]|eukprot:Sro128_g061170.1 Alpha-mannosidase 2 (1271) ;mRNA; r:39503-43390